MCVAACADGEGSCDQYVTRKKLDPPEGYPLVRAVHSRYGVLPGADAKKSGLGETLSMQTFFHDRQDAVYVNIQDKVAADGPYNYPRLFERAMWATNGLCVSDSPPEDVSF